MGASRTTSAARAWKAAIVAALTPAAHSSAAAGPSAAFLSTRAVLTALLRRPANAWSVVSSEADSTARSAGGIGPRARAGLRVAVVVGVLLDVLSPPPHPAAASAATTRTPASLVTSAA